MSGTTIEADTSTAPPFALPNIEPIPEVIPVTRDTPYHREEGYTGCPKFFDVFPHLEWRFR